MKYVYPRSVRLLCLHSRRSLSNFSHVTGTMSCDSIDWGENWSCIFHKHDMGSGRPYGDPFIIRLGTMTRRDGSEIVKRTGSSMGQDDREERSPEGIHPHRVDNSA